ncbi:MAG: flagellar type III secretion system protein FliR [Hyphomicrobiales bacterium]|nr:MAG: flagellar type III secretion system protein FliR [Hyphomicrobiales bacterium]
MADLGPQGPLLAFILFCRIGGCLMLMPGFSSTRVPVQVRLFLAIAITLMLTPLLAEPLRKAVPDVTPDRMVLLIATETLIGSLIGVLGRMFFLALQFMATAAANFVGMSGVAGPGIEEPEQTPTFGVLITLTATLLFFLTDQHWEVLKALVASYRVIPISEPMSAEFSVVKLTEAASSAFLLALQVTSPFLVYTLIANLLVGIGNRLVPQVPVYWVSGPLVMLGGLLVLYFTIGETLRLFTTGFMAWLLKG